MAQGVCVSGVELPQFPEVRRSSPSPPRHVQWPLRAHDDGCGGGGVWNAFSLNSKLNCNTIRLTLNLNQASPRQRDELAAVSVFMTSRASWGTLLLFVLHGWLLG